MKHCGQAEKGCEYTDKWNPFTALSLICCDTTEGTTLPQSCSQASNSLMQDLFHYT